MFLDLASASPHMSKSYFFTGAIKSKHTTILNVNPKKHDPKKGKNRKFAQTHVLDEDGPRHDSRDT